MVRGVNAADGSIHGTRREVRVCERTRLGENGNTRTDLLYVCIIQTTAVANHNRRSGTDEERGLGYAPGVTVHERDAGVRGRPSLKNKERALPLVVALMMVDRRTVSCVGFTPSKTVTSPR